MMFLEKIMQISDPIHGSIQISEMEKQIISTQVFNRLHHILQNSTVFLTFPSNKTTRFAHSIGTMHLGGEIYKYGITNAGKDDSLKFFNKVNSFLDEQIGEKEFQHDIKYLGTGSSEYKRFYSQLLQFKDYEPFYLSGIPAMVPNNSIYFYIVTFQSVRCASLLHDLGHPPFSHITESALDNIYIHLRRKKTEEQLLTQREENFYKIIDFYKSKDDQLHEQLGKSLSDHIFDVLISDVLLENHDETMCKKIFYIHVKHMTLAILNDKDDFFKSLHNIISGPIDCDRLDYVSRDPIASGFNNGKIEYERIIKTMMLIKDNKSTVDKFQFSPSARTINTIEDFFQRRWNMYKYIIMHHRAVKTDTLLREVIEILAKEYLSSNDEETDLNNYQIPNDISGLWKMVDYRENITQKDYINHLIQWDDAWLLACLRREYFSNQQKVNSKNYESSFLIIKLEELLSNKKKYDSLYKRFDGFIELDNALLEKFNLDCLTPFKDHHVIGPIIKRIEFFKQVDLASRKEGYTFVGLFTNILDELFNSWGKVDFDSIVIESIEEITAKFGVEDYIFKRNKLKTGLDKEMINVYYKGELHSLEKYSNIKAELTANKAMFPPFFIYLYSSNGIKSLNDFKRELGSKIAQKIEIILKKEYSVLQK